MTEAVRLVVWDLDETFWKGTVTEGGIREYIQQHHDIVIALARRGILSSICSKNDKDEILAILAERSILDYFVFPSISWEPKGARLVALIETVQLRPATVMFIDDNASNRGEAAAMIPNLQIEDESFIPNMLADPRFKGKDDSALTRLAQYKLLETRKQDETTAAGGNEDFLRNCDIRVCIDYDFDNVANLDRAIELINRTNQLNYTKKRLPEDVAEAREVLKHEIDSFHRQSGLVRVVDKYGDYGYVGFFMTETDVFRQLPENVSASDFRSLRHFCFSCRTLGMLVEAWLYDHLARPLLHTIGDVLTDLSQPRTIDWVRLLPSLADNVAATEPVAPELRLYGGCEVYSIGVYLAPHTKNIEMRGNFSANGAFYRINSSALALSIFDRGGDSFAAEAAFLGVPANLVAGDYFADAPYGTAFVFSGGFDAQRRPHYRHRQHGWEFVLELAGGETLDLTVATEAQVQDRLQAVKNFDAAGLAHIAAIARHIRTDYQTLPGISDEQRVSTMHDLISRLPIGSRLVLMLDHDRLRLPDGTVRDDPPTEHYNNQMKSVAQEYSYVRALSFAEVIDSDEQIQIGGNHYDRIVYLRFAQRLVETLRSLPAKDGPLNVGIAERRIA